MLVWGLLSLYFRTYTLVLVSGSRALTIGCEKAKEETEAKNIENGDISFGSNAVIMAVCLYNSIV